MSAAELLWENPLLIKHIRSRLRRQQLLPMVIVVAVVGACILWGTLALDTNNSGGAFMVLLLVQGGLLLLVATSEIATAVAGARSSGMLDFHRISPQSPVATALGFILGAPIREWVLFAVSLPFSILACLLGKPGLLGGLVVFVVLVASALLFHSIALLVGSTTAQSRSTGGPVALLVFILHSSGATLPVALFTVVPTAMAVLGAERPTILSETFFTVKLPVPLLSLLHILPLLALLFVAGVRKMRSERAPLYSKLQAVVFQATLAFLVLGDVLGLSIEDLPRLPGLVAIYVLALSAALLSFTCTPDAGNYARGIRRARKHGLLEPSAWDDRATNWRPLTALCGIMLVGGFLASAPGVAAQGLAGAGSIVAALVVAAAAVVMVASGRQFFGLRYRKAGGGYLGLVVFLVWVVPIVVGTLLNASMDVVEVAEMTKYVWAISPIMGVGLAATLEPGGVTVVALLASVLPAAVLVYLSLGAERRGREQAEEGKTLAA